MHKGVETREMEAEERGQLYQQLLGRTTEAQPEPRNLAVIPVTPHNRPHPSGMNRETRRRLDKEAQAKATKQRAERRKLEARRVRDEARAQRRKLREESGPVAVPLAG